MENVLKVSISIIKPVFYYIATKGISADHVLKAADLDPLVLNAPDNRVSIEVMDRIYKQAMVLTKDEYLGLHVGEFFAPGSLNIVGHIFMNCQTVHDVSQKFIEYNELLSDGVNVQIAQEKNKLTTIEYIIRHTDVSIMRQHVEYLFSGSMTLLSGLTGKEIKPVEVRLRHKAPEDLSEHHRIFSAPLRFEHSMNALVFENNIKDIPIQQANTELLLFFEQYAKQILSSIHTDKPYTKKVSLLLTKKFQEKLPTIESIAKELSMSVRSLQRKLEKENTSYSIIFNEVYKKLAISYLMNGDLSVAEIAYILGFSEPSAFHRAFKRWTDCTPNEYRTKNI